MVSYHTSRRRYFPTNSDTIHGWYIPSMDRRPVGGKLAAMRYKVETMENPTIHGNPYLPWMVGIHEWDATERHALLSQLRISNKEGHDFCKSFASVSQRVYTLLWQNPMRRNTSLHSAPHDLPFSMVSEQILHSPTPAKHSYNIPNGIHSTNSGHRPYQPGRTLHLHRAYSRVEHTGDLDTLLLHNMCIRRRTGTCRPSLRLFASRSCWGRNIYDTRDCMQTAWAIRRLYGP